MQIIPAIDILDGKVVRLVQGDFSRLLVYNEEPEKIAEKYRQAGASRLHLVNLSAAKKGYCGSDFLELVYRLAQIIEVQVGGGVRDLATMQRFLDAGAAAVVVGTMVILEPETVRAAVDLFGSSSIIAAIDVKDGQVKTHGWLAESGFTIVEAMQRVKNLGIRQVLLTDIAHDGMRSGPNVRLYAEWAGRCPEIRLFAAGGIRNAADIRQVESAGCHAAIVGRALLEQSVSLSSLLGACTRKASEPVTSDRRSGPAIRVIPCLDVMEGRVVKGTNFQNLRDAGDPVELARYYCDQGADELVFLDITASCDHRPTAADLAARVAESVDIPFTIGGGVRTVSDARILLNSGADKVSVNSAAVARPALLEEMAQELGSANVVCAVDARRNGDGWTVLVRGGREDTNLDALAWCQQAVRRGAGELLVTSYDRDGTGEGFDTKLLASIDGRVSVPVIASGGGGTLDSFVAAVREGGADAVLAAGVFHFGKLSIRDVKNALLKASFPVRL